MPPTDGEDPRPTPVAATSLTLHDVLVALREHLKSIAEPLRRDTVRDTAVDVSAYPRTGTAEASVKQVASVSDPSEAIELKLCECSCCREASR